MFERLEVLAERLLAADPDQTDPREAALDPDGELVDELVLLDRVTSAAEARRITILAGLCRRAEGWQDRHEPRSQEVGPEDLVAAEIAPALHLTPVTASIRVRRAITIATRLSATLAALGRGELDLGRVLAIDDATFCLSDPDAAKVEQAVLPAAVDQNAAELRAALRQAVIAVDPAAAEKRRKQAVKDRGVTRYQDQDGTSVLRAVLSAIDTGEIYDLVDQVARRTKTSHDTRTSDARRADALVWLLLGRDPHLGPEDDDQPPAPPQPPSADPCDDDRSDDVGRDDSGPDDRDLADPADDGVRFGPDPDDPGSAEPAEPETVPPDPAHGLVNPGWRRTQLTRFDRISELAALALSAMTTRRPPKLPWVTINQTTGPDGTVCSVGELQGLGPITAEAAEHLLTTGAATPRPEPSGREPTPAQARTHDPPGWLDQEVRIRDGTCRFPGCRRSAHRVDLDHTVPFPRGLTVRPNLGGLCRRHHRVKGSGCWTVVQNDDGIYEWVSKITGRGYTTYPRGTTGDWRGTTNHRR